MNHKFIHEIADLKHMKLLIIVNNQREKINLTEAVKLLRFKYDELVYEDDNNLKFNNEGSYCFINNYEIDNIRGMEFDVVFLTENVKNSKNYSDNIIPTLINTRCLSGFETIYE